MDLKLHRIRHVGLAFKVKQPMWDGDAPKRGTSAVLSVATDNLTVAIALDGKMVASLNRSDAMALGTALVAEADRLNSIQGG